MNSFASGLPDNMDILHDVYVAMKLKSLPKEDLKLKVNQALIFYHQCVRFISFERIT